MKKISELKDVTFDGVINPYIPGERRAVCIARR